MRAKSIVRFALIATMGLLVACSVTPGGLTSQATLSGTISGSLLSSETKLAVYFSAPSTTAQPDDVLSVNSGAFSYLGPVRI